MLSDFLSVIEMAEYKCAIDAHYFHPPDFSRGLLQGVPGSIAHHAYYRDLQVPARARSYLGIRLTVARLHGTCQRRYGQRCCTAYEERRIKEWFSSLQRWGSGRSYRSVLLWTLSFFCLSQETKRCIPHKTPPSERKKAHMVLITETHVRP